MLAAERERAVGSLSALEGEVLRLGDAVSAEGEGARGGQPVSLGG